MTNASTATPLRAAFDATPEVAARTGVARYSRELGRALERGGDCELVRFAIGRTPEPVPAGARHLRLPLRAVHGLWRVFGVPRAEQLTGAVDVVHSIDLVPPPTRLPLVMTVHDLVAVELPDLHPPRAVAAQKARLAALSRATEILTVSHATADAISARGIPSERIHVAPAGLTPLPDPIDPPVPPGPYILVVGTIEPRKGHEILVRALASADIGSCRLVIAGPTDGRSQSLLELARDLGVAERLTVLGTVEDAVLSGLYRDATLVCMPSLAEGFGLPVLEALSYGVPVVASDLDAIREVTGGSAVLTPAGEVEPLARALEVAIADEQLRARLRDAGPVQAARFTWEAAAAETAAAYRRAVEKGLTTSP